MRPSVLLLSFLFLASPGALASWFSSDDSYTSWDNTQLKQWLDEHHITSHSTPASSFNRDQLLELVKDNWNSASAWTYDQYADAQKTFGSLRDSTFDAWDESRLREFLLEQGIVAPKGPREELVLLAKSRYRAYTDAASSFASTASQAASTAIYGDSTHQASKSISSIAAQATKEAQKTFDNSKDYVYSTWSDSDLKKYLVQKGVMKSDAQKTRDEMLRLMQDSYAKVADPVWQAWSDSFMRDWLASHNLIDDRSPIQKTRDEYLEMMKQYYYNVNDRTWDTWSDSDLRGWLVEHGVVKSDAEIKREKMLKLVEDNYLNAKNTAWDAWSDSQMREWLIEHGYLRSDAQVKRDELVKLMNEKYQTVSDKTAAYLTWPDARLRAYLRERGISENLVPTTRPGLLQEVRIRWVQTQNRSEALYQNIRDIVNSNLEAAEDKLTKMWELMSGQYQGAKRKGEEGYEKGKVEYEEKKEEAYEKAKKAQAEL
ncbi:hypothetical protein K435DRAFT_775444 [Dendrothele bispora CBS 962.96]|uniref:Uncharacterized protein n=1 Tax=Dendrothele bispora (strain CBS 962.96) TaxID=1314807 RepID=A0A4S8MKB9_DENBC|nr:hypothetical protein K435DRAFT_775444 [Dendrothele bispora CBS 962.96]